MKVAYKNHNVNVSSNDLSSILNSKSNIELLDLVPSRGYHKIDAVGHEMHNKQVRIFGNKVCIKITARSFHPIGDVVITESDRISEVVRNAKSFDEILDAVF